MNKEELEAQILYYSTKYYEGNPEISDEQFDMLVDKLRLLDPKSKVLQTGWGFEVNGDKVKHKYSHIGSLDKTKSYEDIPERFINRTIYISPKLDGLSAVAYYENGILVRGITRGNGEYGKDITNKLLNILDNQIFDKTFTGAVRGELIINESNWKILQQKYNNLIAPRNFAAGIINRKDLDDDIQYVDMVVYKVVGQENKQTFFTKREDMLQWLKANFKHCIPIYYYPVLNKSSWETYHLSTFNDFKKLGYGLDGLVLTSPDIVYDNISNGYIFDEIAFKFPAESTTTVIKNIEWELSRTQRLVPVAVIEPVELSGAIVERATCNNAKWVQDMELGKGAEIEICRSNEVIPQILSVLQPYELSLPTKCPMCGQDLVWEGVDLKCNNPNCANIKLSDLQQWCENVGKTDGLQWTLMKQYLDMYGINDIDTLYAKQDFVWQDLNTRKLSITEHKVKDFFEALYFKQVSMENALVGLNIPRLGEKTAKILSAHFDLVYQLLLLSIMPIYSGVTVKLGENNKPTIFGSDNDWVELRLLELVKEATTETILCNIHKFSILRYLFNEDYSNTRIVYTRPTTDITYVAVTGALYSMKRKDFEKYIAKYGYELSSSIKKCKYLITNTPDSGSSKNKDAQKYGIEIITEQEFLNMLNN